MTETNTDTERDTDDTDEQQDHDIDVEQVSADELPEPDFEGHLPPDDLEVDGDNPNEMDDEMFSLLCERIRTRGWVGNAIVTDTEGTIADGEHRWKAAKELGLDEIPVKQYALDDDERRLWRQELNKIHGEHDKERDALEFDLITADDQLRDDTLDLLDTQDESLDEYLDLIRMDPPEKDVHAHGYDADNLNVHYQDCIAGMREHLDDNSVDMVFTSPPYNQQLGAGNDKKLRDTEAYEDDMDPSEYRAFIEDVFEELARVVKPTGHIFFNIGLRYNDGTITVPHWVPDLCPVTWRSYIVWNKNNTGRASISLQENGRFAGTWEPVYHFAEHPEPLRNRRNFDVWNAQQSSDEPGHDTGKHPAPFSVDLVDTAINATTDEGDLVLDPFLGSGTTAVAAINRDRDYIGFELDDEGAYKPIIQRRLRDAIRAKTASVNTPADGEQGVTSDEEGEPATDGGESTADDDTQTDGEVADG